MKCLRLIASQQKQIVLKRKEKSSPRGGYVPVLVNLLSGTEGWTIKHEGEDFVCVIGPIRETSKFLEQAVCMALLKAKEHHEKETGDDRS